MSPARTPAVNRSHPALRPSLALALLLALATGPLAGACSSGSSGKWWLEDDGGGAPEPSESRRSEAAEPAAVAGAGGPGRAPAEPAAAGQMVRIPGDEVTLGSDAEQKRFGYSIGGQAARDGRWFDGERLRTVELEPYWIDLTPVTQAAYGRFVRDTGHRVPYITESEYQEQGYLVHPYAEVLPYLWFSDRPPAEKANHPVVLVSVEDAQTYCRWRGDRQGAMCRLPTEDEWELAARGEDGNWFPWGDEWEPGRLNTVFRGPYGTTPVTRYPEGRSPYGLYDMAGNVFEWTATPGRPGYSILKSCSWDDFGGICRGAARHQRRDGARHILIGFRCACESEPRTARER